MPKNATKTKSHRSEHVKYHIQYYTPKVFNTGDLEDSEETMESKTPPKTMKIPVKIDANRYESRANVTT